MAAGNHEQENRTNALTEQHVKSAIETVLCNTEQSYEDFMSCFVGLKKEDVVAYHVHQLSKQGNDPAEGQMSEEGTDEVADPRPARNDSVMDEVETEELGEGHFAPTRQTTDLPAGHRFIQMDNFVDDAELLGDDRTRGQDDDEELASTRYESSFGIVDSSTASPLKLSKDLVGRIEGPDGRDDDKDRSSGAHLERERGCEMRTLPGEAEEDGEERGGRASSLPDDAVHRTELDMSTRRSQEAAPTEGAPQSGTSSEVSGDDVQPFSLDTDFDYDNVVLTPKWDSHRGPPGWKPGQ